MAYDHYIPASFLGRFSEIPLSRSRESLLWVVHKKSGNVFHTKAERICGKKGLYEMHGPISADKMLSAYEPRLSIALDALIEKNVDALAWIATLVPFVAGLLVRTPDFHERFIARFPVGLEEFLTPENSNWARITEISRLKPAIATAHWHVIETTGNLRQITNDLGYMYHRDRATGQVGLAIPIGPRHILVLLPASKRVVVYFDGMRWLPTIEYFTIEDNNHQLFLDRVADWSQNLIIGSDASVAKYKNAAPFVNPMPEPHGIFLNGLRATHQRMIYDLLVTLKSPPPKEKVAIEFLLNPNSAASK